MAVDRQPKLQPAMRVCATLLLIAWVSASATCTLESAFGHSEAGDEHKLDQAAHHEDDAGPMPGDSSHSQDSDKNGSDNHCCCSSLNATAQIPNATHLSKPDFGKSLWPTFIWPIHALALDQSETAVSRQPPDREWPFTPEVSLGPAFRSHAPPILA